MGAKLGAAVGATERVGLEDGANEGGLLAVGLIVGAVWKEIRTVSQHNLILRI